jgi:hypothetical protein
MLFRRTPRTGGPGAGPGQANWRVDMPWPCWQRYAPYAALLSPLLGMAGCVGEAAQQEQRHPLDGVTVCDLSALAESPTGLTLTEVLSLDVDSEGRVYLLDGRTIPRLLSLTPDLTQWSIIAGVGEGPGELKQPQNLQVFSGDSLLVYDLGTLRVSVFAPNAGSLAYDRALAPTTGPAVVPQWVYRTQRGAFLVVARRPVMGPLDIGRPRNRILRVLDSDGFVLHDSILTLPETSDFIHGRLERITFAVANPAGRKGLVRIGPEDRIYHGLGDSLAIDIFTIEGHRVGRLGTSYRPFAFTAEDLDSLLARQEGIFARPEALAQIRARAPRTWPAFQHFVVDDNENVWVGAITPGDQPTRWIVLNSNNQIECGFTLPKNTMIHAVRDRNAYAVAVDQLDVPRVIIYRVGRRNFGEDRP